MGLKKIFEKMKNIKPYRLFENQSFPTDPEEIESICDDYGLEEYTINPDGTVDVDGDVDLAGLDLDKLPLKFGKINGNFICQENRLTTLEGAPREVLGSFDCLENSLTSLEGAPRVIGGDFVCRENFLTSLEGSPREIPGDFDCSINRLSTLVGGPKKIFGSFSFSWNDIINSDGWPILRVDSDEFMDYDGNPIKEIISIFETDENFIKSLEYKYFAGGNKIHESRFVRACDDLGVTAPDHIKGYEWV